MSKSREEIFASWSANAPISRESFDEAVTWLLADPARNTPGAHMTRELGCEAGRGLVRLERKTGYLRVAFYELDSGTVWWPSDRRVSISPRDVHW